MVKNTYYISLSILRIYVAFHIIKKYFLYFDQKEMLFGTNTFITFSESPLFSILGLDAMTFREHITIIINAILLLSLLWSIGIGKNITNILLYISIELIQRLNGYLLNGGDNLLKYILLYMSFTNCYQYLILYKSTWFKQWDTSFATYLGVLAIKIHLCVIYFISAIFKINSQSWFNGIANYYILQSERFKGTSFNISLANNTWFVTLSTYFTLLWEIAFPFLIWFRKMRVPLITCGIILHLSIYLFMMIHDFEILFMMTYILFFTDQDLREIKNNIYIIAKKCKSTLLEKLKQQTT